MGVGVGFWQALGSGILLVRGGGEGGRRGADLPVAGAGGGQGQLHLTRGRVQLTAALLATLATLLNNGLFTSR